MADLKDPTNDGYSPEMDANTHESTYRGFVTMTEIGTVVVICHVVALALGGVKAAWTTAILGVILSIAAGAVGALVPRIGWRAPAAVLALLLVALVLF